MRVCIVARGRIVAGLLVKTDMDLARDCDKLPMGLREMLATERVVELTSVPVFAATLGGMRLAGVATLRGMRLARVVLMTSASSPASAAAGVPVEGPAAPWSITEGIIALKAEESAWLMSSLSFILRKGIKWSRTCRIPVISMLRSATCYRVECQL